ncbi:MAG TPA: LPS export ABC transporter permease LptG [Syntrophorhabdales bacterium]|nr:LPS export ABC transporter permease LptG [Syntrophorhabdales bacterium]
MRKLSRYLVKNVLKFLVLSEFAGVAVFVIIEFFDHVELFTQTFRNLLYGAAYLALRLPYYFNLILPLCFLISILILIIVMIRANEVILVRTSGISTLAMMKPLLFLSLALVAFSFILSDWIIPVSSTASEYIYKTKIKQEQSMVYFKNDKIWFKRGNTICNIGFFDTKKDTMKDVTVIELSDQYSIRKRYDMKDATWTDGAWVFHDVVERTFGPTGVIGRRFYPALTGLIEEPPSVFKIVERSPEEMSYGELRRYISRLQRNGHDITRYLVDLDNKVAFPFINVIMVLTAFSVGLRYSKTKQISKGIFAGISVGMLYWFFHSVSLSLGYSEIFPPLFAAWFANLFFFSLGTVGVLTLRT